MRKYVSHRPDSPDDSFFILHLPSPWHGDRFPNGVYLYDGVSPMHSDTVLYCLYNPLSDRSAVAILECAIGGGVRTVGSASVRDPEEWFNKMLDKYFGAYESMDAKASRKTYVDFCVGWEAVSVDDPDNGSTVTTGIFAPDGLNIEWSASEMPTSLIAGIYNAKDAGGDWGDVTITRSGNRTFSAIVKVHSKPVLGPNSDCDTTTWAHHGARSIAEASDWVNDRLASLIPGWLSYKCKQNNEVIQKFVQLAEVGDLKKSRFIFLPAGITGHWAWDDRAGFWLEEDESKDRDDALYQVWIDEQKDRIKVASHVCPSGCVSQVRNFEVLSTRKDVEDWINADIRGYLKELDYL